MTLDCIATWSCDFSWESPSHLPKQYFLLRLQKWNNKKCFSHALSLILNLFSLVSLQVATRINNILGYKNLAIGKVELYKGEASAAGWGLWPDAKGVWSSPGQDRLMVCGQVLSTRISTEIVTKSCPHLWLRKTTLGKWGLSFACASVIFLRIIFELGFLIFFF